MSGSGFQFAPAEAAWAEVARLRGLLSKLEWAGSYASAPGDDAMWAACPVCGARMQYDERRHQHDCWLAKELGRP
jgi:hypothetical protein